VLGYSLEQAVGGILLLFGPVSASWLRVAAFSSLTRTGTCSGSCDPRLVTRSQHRPRRLGRISTLSGDRDRLAIIAVIDQEVSAAASGDLQAYAAMLADDAVLMPPNGDARSGTALRMWLQQFLEGFAVEWLSFQHGEVAVQGRLGYHCYEYEWRVRPRDGGAPTVSHGKGLHVMRREDDRSWKIVGEIWNASPAHDS